MTPVRPPPHDLNAETAILSAVLLVGREVFADVADVIDAKDFYSNAHTRIFEAARAEYDAGRPIDIGTVATRLKTNDRLAEVGGFPYLTQILNDCPALANTAAYADTVRTLAVQRRLLAGLQKATAQIYLGVDDVGAFLSDLESQVHSAAMDRARTDSMERIGDVGRRVVAKLHELRLSGKKSFGNATGLDRLDRQTGGQHPGELTIIAARPGMGKTSLAMRVAKGVANGIVNEDGSKPLVSLFFSLEMPREQLAQRALCVESGTDLSLIRNGQLTDATMRRLAEAADKIQSDGVLLEDQARTLEAIRSTCRRKQSELARSGKSIGVVIIDYLQIMKLPQAERHDLRLGEVTRGLKEMSVELKLPVVLLSQLNRETEKRNSRRPQISDLKDSGHIENDADCIVFIYRDEAYDRDSDYRNMAELIVAKQRNGPVGGVLVGFDKETTKFWNLPEGEYEPPPAREHVDHGGHSNYQFANGTRREDR